jgi:hypothetical protein
MLPTKFQRDLKCEKLTDDGRQVMAKAHFAFGKVSWKKIPTYLHGFFCRGNRKQTYILFWANVFDITLTDIFQYHNQSIDTDIMF